MSNFELKELKDGRPNPKYVDMLEEDKAIAGQKFVCLSFVSPENILKDKNQFYFEKFLGEWEYAKSMEKYMQFLNFIAFKYNVTFSDITKDFADFVEEEKERLRESTIKDDFKTFVEKNEEDLENQFNTAHDFQTSIRGLKVRGVYPSMEEAELRCKMLREVDPNHDVFVGPVGLWMPWDPEPTKTGRVEYLEETLNELMSKKNQNESFAKSAFESRVKETKRKAIEENVRKAQSAGTTLTQTIDDAGNLVSANILSSQERSLREQIGEDEISVGDIRNELFEGENIVVPHSKSGGGNGSGSGGGV